MKAKKRSKPHPMPVDALVYPRFSGVPTFMHLPHIPHAEELDLALIGVPFDGGTTYRPGPRFGPRNIRVQSAMIRPWNPVLKINPFEKWRIADFGDLSINPLSIEDTYRGSTEQLGEVLRAGARPVCVGGDHAILLRVLRAIHKHFGQDAFIQLDAHGDTWGGYFGSPQCHGTPQVGGLSSAQILDLVRSLRGLDLVGCDLVEVSPPYDNGEITSLLAANLLFELLCLF